MAIMIDFGVWSKSSWSAYSDGGLVECDREEDGDLFISKQLHVERGSYSDGQFTNEAPPHTS